MFEKPSPQQLAEEAVRHLDLAEKFESQENWAKAIEEYSKAVDLLKRSGLLSLHIDDINERIMHLTQISQQNKALQRKRAEAEFSGLRDEAFHFLDKAKSLEVNGRYQEAISCYSSAIKLLEQAKWDESLLGQIKLKLEKLVDIFKQQQIMAHQRALKTEQAPIKVEKSFGAPETTIVPAGLDKRSKLRMEFETQKRKEEDIQNSAFEAIDMGKKLLEEKNFNVAKSKYLEALDLLRSIGWTDENLSYLYGDIDSVERQRVAFEKVEGQKVEQAARDTPQPIISEIYPQKEIVPEIMDVQSKTIMKYEAKKRREDEVQKKAFELMDEGERLIKVKEFDEAMEKYGMAGQLLESIGWADQLVHINKIIDKINKDRVNYKKLQTQQIKAKKEAVTAPVPEISAKAKADIEVKKQKIVEFEERKKHEESIQKEAFKMIDIAKRFERDKQYDGAIENFNGAIDLLQSIGWTDYVKPIYKFISDIRRRQENEQKVLEEKKSREKEYLKFQEIIKKHEKIQTEQGLEGISLKQKELEKTREIDHAKEKKAFNVINEADELVRKGSYEKAIKTYKKAHDIFREIGWVEQIATIETTINTVQHKYREFLKNDEKATELKVKRAVEDEEFRKTIAEQIRKEREKLEKKKIEIREYETEIEYRKKRKVEAFKILDEAEEYTLRGDFDVAIEKYYMASMIFVEIQWTDELSLIQSVIRNLENKKKERRLLSLKEREDGLKREKETKEFQAKISEQLREEREKLREKEITVREYEKEVKYREKQKDKAFKILDDAQKLTISGDFDEAIEKYEVASIIFAEIQWDDELALIQNAIRDLENNKKERELREQKIREELLKREQETQEFQNMIAKELRIEREKLRESQITLREYEQEVDYRENRKNEAFDILDAAKMLIMRGDLDAAIEKYHEASIIFAEIRWTEELALIQGAIRKLEQKKKEKELWEQIVREESIKKEQEVREFQHEIALIKSQQEEKVKFAQYIQEQKEILSEQKLKKQEEALKMLETSYEHISNGNLDEAIRIHKSAIEILNQIGWKSPYLRVIKDTLENLNRRKIEIVQKLQRQKELTVKHEAEEREFQARITHNIELEKKKMYVKKIATQTKERLLAYREKERIEAFDVMNKAEILTKRGNFDESLDLYRQADIILSEIQFPSHAVKEMIQKIKLKQKEQKELLQKERKIQIHRQLEEATFQKEITRRLAFEREKMIVKKIAIETREKIEVYREQKREEAFKILDEAEDLTKTGNFELAINRYRNAMLLLSKIQYPVDSIHEMIGKVRLKKIEQEEIKRREIDLAARREIESREFREKIAWELRRESERLARRTIALIEYEAEVEYREDRKKEAFDVLDSAKLLTLRGDFDASIEKYREASIILAEIQWTKELTLIQNTIRQLENRKKERELWEQQYREEAIKREIEEREFQEKITEISRKEREKLREKEIALREYEQEKEYREKRRDEAFKILDKAEKFTIAGDFDVAIEKYHEASIIFAEIQWTEELALIQNAVRDLEYKKKERVFWEQKARENAIWRELEAKKFQTDITEALKKEHERLKEKEIAIREYEKEVKYREMRKEEAFHILDSAQILTMRGNFDEAIERYHEASIILAEIQWIEELNHIQNAISELNKKKKERELWQLELREAALKQEHEIREFQHKISIMKKSEEDKVKMAQFIQEQQGVLSEQQLKKQNEALKMLEVADTHIKRGQLDDAIEIYRLAVDIFNKIGWKGSYLKVIQDTFDNLTQRKFEVEQIKQHQIQLAAQREAEEREFQAKITRSIESEKKKMLAKEIAIQTQEQIIAHREKRRNEAFDNMDKAEELTKTGKFDESLTLYRQADIILSEIQFPSYAVREMIQKIKIKQKEQVELRQKEREIQIKRQQEEEAFQREVARQVALEREKMKVKEIEIETQENVRAYREKRRNEVFNILDEAELLTKRGNLDLAIDTYRKAALYLTEIQYPVDAIYEMISKLRIKKIEQDQMKQQEIEASTRRELEYRRFQEEIAQALKREEERLKEKEIKLREYEKEKEYREKIKDEAFIILDKAKQFMARGNFDAGIEKYHEASIILAEIQWTEELRNIQNAIRELEKRKKERELWEQKAREEALKREQEAREFQYNISQMKAMNEEKIKMAQFIQEQQKVLSERNFLKQNETLKMLEVADAHIKRGKLDDAIEIYMSAMKIFNEIGWKGPYLKLIQDTLDNLNKRKFEIEQIKQQKIELEVKRDAEERDFQAKIAQGIEIQKQKMLAKKIAIQTQEEIFAHRENRRKEAFDIIDKAEKMTKEENFDDALRLYRQADIFLSEIQFPSNIVKEMIPKIKLKQREQEDLRQREREIQIQKQLEEEGFQREIAYHIKLEKEKMRSKKTTLEAQEIIKDYREQRREEAFRVLEEAEQLTNSGKYELAIGTYRNAMLILSEIQYPTDSINEMIKKVQNKKLEQEHLKHIEMEAVLQREQEEKYLEEEIAQKVQLEQGRMMEKLKAIVSREKIQVRFEQRREEAFKVLEEAEQLIKTDKFDEAIETYRKASLILSEIQYPLESINEMIRKLQMRKSEQAQIIQQEKEARLQRESEEAELRRIIEERQRQEEEMKRAKYLALKQREELIKKVESRREVAFSLLENADKFLKQFPPDFDKSIELYLEARNVLLEINWEPEIANLDAMIRSLREEKQKFIIQQKQEEEARIRAAEEYEKFNQEILRKKLEVQRVQEVQRMKLEAFKFEQEQREKLQQEGFNLLDDAKKSVLMHQFNFAYEQFDQAIEKFKRIGWFEQIKYIEKEIETTKKLEENAIKAQEEVKRAQEALLKQKGLEDQRRIEEETIKIHSVKEITAISDDIIKSLRQQRLEQESTQVVSKEQIKSDAASFAKELTKMIKIKQDLMAEIAKAEEDEKEKTTEKEKQKTKEELKELHKWIKDAAKKSKKK